MRVYYSYKAQIKEYDLGVRIAMADKNVRDIKGELVELLYKAHTIHFDDDKKDPDDEKLPPEAKFNVNFEYLFKNYNHELAELILYKIKECVYGEIGVDCILGFGNSGTNLSVSMDTLLKTKEEFEDLREKKKYRIAHWDKNKKIIGDLRPGDRVALIDEAIISGSTILKDLYDAQVQFYGKYMMDTQKENVSNGTISEIKLTFPVVIFGLDFLVTDPIKKKPKSEIVVEEIGRLYNGGNNPKFMAIATIDDYAERVGEEKKVALKKYVDAQRQKMSAEVPVPVA